MMRFKEEKYGKSTSKFGNRYIYLETLFEVYIWIDYWEIDWLRECHVCYMKYNQKPCTKTKKVVDSRKRSKTKWSKASRKHK